MAPVFPRLALQCVLLPRGSRPRKSRPASAVARRSRPTASPPTHCIAEAVLGWVAKAVVWSLLSWLGQHDLALDRNSMQQPSYSDHNRCRSIPLVVERGRQCNAVFLRFSLRFILYRFFPLPVFEPGLGKESYGLDAVRDRSAAQAEDSCGAVFLSASTSFLAAAKSSR